MACLFPSCCVACECPLRYCERVFCLYCRRQFAFGNSIACNKAENKFDYSLEGVFILNVFHNAGIVQRTLHAMKYQYRTDAAHEAGKIIADFMPPLTGILVPVPQTSRKRRIRGYNQAEMIALGIAENSSLRLETGILGRIGAHRSQTTKTRTDRIRTLGIYSKSGIIIRESVWLVDDVVTTGATINACIDVLKISGASKIGVIAWATA